MDKMIIEDAYVLSAEVKDELKKDGENYVPTGKKKLVIKLFVDSKGDNIATGDFRIIQSIKDPSFDVNALCSKFKRFDKITAYAYMTTFQNRIDYKFYKILRDGVDLTAASAPLTPADNEPLPF